MTIKPKAAQEIMDIIAERDRLLEEKRQLISALDAAVDLMDKEGEATPLKFKTAITINAALAKITKSCAPEPVKYGCHCEIEAMDDGFEPDACVIDGGNINDCIYAVKLQREGKGKLDCEYWKPITLARKSCAPS